MNIANVFRPFLWRQARSLTEFRGVSGCETPRRKRSDEKALSHCAESAESESMSYTCVGARARGVVLAERDSSDSGVSVLLQAIRIEDRTCYGERNHHERQQADNDTWVSTSYREGCGRNAEGSHSHRLANECVG